MSFVEGSLQVEIGLAPGTVERLQKQLQAMEKGTALKIAVDARPLQQASKQADQFAKAATKGFQQVGAEAQKTQSVFSRMGAALSTVNSKVSSISGSTRTLVSNNNKLKASYKEVGSSTGAIANLPKEFGQLQASVLSSTSSLDKAAKSGDHFAASMLPFLRIGTIMARDLDSAGFSLRALDKNLKILVNHVVPFEQQVPSAFRKAMAAATAFDKRSNFEKFREGLRGVKEDIHDFIQAPKELEKVSKQTKNLPTQLFFGAPGLDQATHDQVRRQAEKAGKVFHDVISETAAKGATDLQQSLFPIAAAKTNGDKTAVGFLASLRRRFKDESGAISLGMGSGLTNTGPFKALKAAASGAATPIKDLTGSVSGLGGALGGAGTGALAAGAAIVALGVAAVSAAADFERIQLALSGIFRDGAGALALITNFAARTPFSLETAANAVIKLGSSIEGLSPKQAVSVLTEISGAAASIGAGEDSINRVVIALGQVNSAGRLTADNLRQVTEAMPNISKVNIIKNLAENLGISTKAARDLLENGLVPAEDGLKAIIETAHEATFPGALAKQAQTFQGRLSTAKDEFKQLLAVIGSPILQVASLALKAINVQLQVATNIAHQVAAPIGAFINQLGKLPFIGGAIKSVTAAVSAHGDAWEGAESDIDGALNSLDAVGRAAENVANGSLFDIPKNLGALFNAVNDKADQFQQKQGELFKKVLQSKSAFEAQANAAKQVTEAQQAYNDAIREHNEQLAQDTIRLTDQLTDARTALADADQRVIDAQAALTEAQKAADPADIEQADLSLASAKLKLRQMIEDEKKANEALLSSQEDLNEEQTVTLDLSGLSLDQIKTKLAGARAALAVARSTKKITKETTDDKKSVEQLEIDALQKGIDRRELELEIQGAEETILDLRKQGTALDPAVISARQQVLQAEKDRAKSLEGQQKAQVELNGLSKEDLDWTRQKQGLQEGITTARLAQRDADREAATAVAESKGNQQTINDLLFSNIRESPKLLKILQDSNLTEEQRIDIQRRLGIEIDKNNVKLATPITQQITQTLTVAPALQGTNPALMSGGLLGVGSTTFNTGMSTADALGGAARLLQHAADRFVLTDKAIAEIAKHTGVSIPQFKTGGIANFGTETLAKLHGTEAVLPLDNAQRAFSVLKSALPQMPAALQQRLAPALLQAAPAAQGRVSGVVGGALSRQAARQEKKELAALMKQAFVEALKEAQTGGDQHLTFHVDQTAPNTQLSERQLERAVSKALRR